MKYTYKFLAGALSVIAFSACINETLEQDQSNIAKGKMTLNVDLSRPQSRAVSEVRDFPVIIYDATGKQVQSYDAVSDVPAQITMGVGNYVVESHTPGTIRKKMTSAFYNGKQTVEVLKGVTSQVEVLCKMQNSLISVNYDAEYRSVFSSWEITIDDGSETGLSFTNTDANNTVYWYFGENGVKTLTVNFRGITTEGSTVAARSILTKDQAGESYDDDRENFSGGDAITLNFAPTEATDGKLTSITINASVTFTETNETVNVNVVDKPGFDDNTDSGDSGTGDGSTDTGITLSLPQNMTVAADTDPTLGDTSIGCVNGIKSIAVKITSTSDDMISSLSDLNDGYGVDFVNGAEVVGNQAMVSLFTDLGKTLSVPAEGDKSYTFPIGNFFSLLAVLPGTHTFNMVITDMNGNKKNGSLVLTVE